MTADDLLKLLSGDMFDDLSEEQKAIVTRVLDAHDAEELALRDALDRFETSDNPTRDRWCSQYAESRGEREAADARRVVRFRAKDLTDRTPAA